MEFEHFFRIITHYGKSCPLPNEVFIPINWLNTLSFSATIAFILAVTKLNKTNLLKLETALNEGDVSNQWYQLGMELKLGFKVLLDIGKLADREVTACLLFVLLKWLMNKDPLPTLECLASALSSPSVGKSCLADSLLKNKDKYNC